MVVIRWSASQLYIAARRLTEGRRQQRDSEGQQEALRLAIGAGAAILVLSVPAW